MRQSIHRFGALALGGLLALPAAVCATEVYRWVDADGVVHFSQTAPPQSVDGVSRETLHNDRPSDYDPSQDIYDVAGQRERMQALREELEAQREAQRQREAQAAAQQRLARPPEQSGFPVYWGPVNRPRPPVRPKPPIERPVERPRPSVPVKPPGSGGGDGGA